MSRTCVLKLVGWDRLAVQIVRASCAGSKVAAKGGSPSLDQVNDVSVPFAPKIKQFGKKQFNTTLVRFGWVMCYGEICRPKGWLYQDARRSCSIVSQAKPNQTLRTRPSRRRDVMAATLPLRS